MTISLKKDSAPPAPPKPAGLEFVSVTLSWSMRQTFGKDFDLDISCFLLGADGRAGSEKDFIFYNNPASKCGAVAHLGDNRAGESDFQDSETINIDFPKLPASTEKIAIAATIHDADKNGQIFGMVENARVAIRNRGNDRELAFFYLNEAFHNDSAVIICEFYRKNGTWRLRSMEDQSHGTLSAIAGKYGVDAE